MISWGFLQYGVYALLALIAGSLIAGRIPPLLGPATAWLERRDATLLLGLLGALMYWWMWGSLNTVPLVHDEAGYVLQAQIFARGMWAAPAPPLPHFFEQFHVFVTPVLAPKYPPGHALLLVPGVWLGVPGLVPVILNGLTGALLFAIVRRLSNPWVGILAWFLWLVAPANLFFRQSYFSEVSTGFLMLLAWWYLMEWRESGSLRSLVIVSAAVGWSAITRPLTALAFAIPIMVYVVWQGWQRREWRQLLIGAAVGAVMLLLLPWQSVRVTGDWRVTAYRHYSDVYFPFDVPGFDTQDLPPQRELPPDMQQFRQSYLQIHQAHTLEALPTTLRDRLKRILQSTWGSWGVALAPLAAIALLGMTVELGFALVSFALLVLAYLLFAHPAEWVLYYMEAQQIVVMVTAFGVWTLIQWVMRLQRRGAQLPAGESVIRGGVAVCAFLLVLAPFKAKFIAEVRDPFLARGVMQGAFRDMMAALPEPSIVFVRYSRIHDIHASLITNVPDLERANVWTVYDRGAENLDLLPYAEGRVPYIFDEQSGLLHPLDPATGDIAQEDDASVDQSPSGTP